MPDIGFEASPPIDPRTGLTWMPPKEPHPVSLGGYATFCRASALLKAAANAEDARFALLEKANGSISQYIVVGPTKNGISAVEELNEIFDILVELLRGRNVGRLVPVRFRVDGTFLQYARIAFDDDSVVVIMYPSWDLARQAANGAVDEEMPGLGEPPMRCRTASLPGFDSAVREVA